MDIANQIKALEADIAFYKKQANALLTVYKYDKNWNYYRVPSRNNKNKYDRLIRHIDSCYKSLDALFRI